MDKLFVKDHSLLFHIPAGLGQELIDIFHNRENIC